jgi:ferric-chelate reductase
VRHWHNTVHLDLRISAINLVVSWINCSSPSAGKLPYTPMSQVVRSLSHLSKATHASGVDDFVFIFHIDILIVSFFVLFGIFTLPRLFVRFSRRSEWFLGLLLHPYNYAKVQTFQKPLYIMSASNGMASSTNICLKPGWQHGVIAQKEVLNKDLPPRRMPSWSSRLHVVSAILGREVSKGYTIGQFSVFLGYFCIILYAGVYKGSPFRFWRREGIITMSQVPIVFALATKNNVFGMILAVGYEKVGFSFKKWIGMLLTA